MSTFLTSALDRGRWRDLLPGQNPRHPLSSFHGPHRRFGGQQTSPYRGISLHRLSYLVKSTSTEQSSSMVNKCL